MAATERWRELLGTPWCEGLPDDGAAAMDCLQLVLLVLAEAGEPCPALDPRWYRVAAGRGGWGRLRRLIEAGTDAVSGRRPYDVALLAGPGDGFGFGLAAGGGILTSDPERGAHWRPYRGAAVQRWFRFRR